MARTGRYRTIGIDQQGDTIASIDHRRRIGLAAAASAVLALAVLGVLGWRALGAQAAADAHARVLQQNLQVERRLHTAFLRELLHLQLLATSDATIEWLRDEQDAERRGRFARDGERLRARLASGEYSIVHAASRRYYHAAAGRLVRRELDPARPADAGYLALIETIDDYAVRALPGANGEPGRLWLGVPVRDGGATLGLVGAAMPIEPVLTALLARDDAQGAAPHDPALYIVDARGAIVAARDDAATRRLRPVLAAVEPLRMQTLLAQARRAAASPTPSAHAVLDRGVQVAATHLPALDGFVVAVAEPQPVPAAMLRFAYAAAAAVAIGAVVLAFAAVRIRRRARAHSAPPVADAAPAEPAPLRTAGLLTRSGHEIRTPMNALIGMCRLALKTASDPRQRQQLERALAAADDLSRTAAGIIDLAKIEAGEFVLDQRPFDLREVLQPLCDVIVQRTGASGVDVAFRIAPDVPPRLVGDPFQFGQVLVHLAVHAIPADAAGEIVVDLHVRERSGPRVQLGIAIPEPRCGVHATRALPADSIGLAIGRLLLERMHGAIDDAPAAGTRFACALPLAVPDDASADATASAARVDRQAAHAFVRSIDGLAGARVLVVDDNALNREVALDVLSEFPVAVAVAEDGRQAVQQVLGGDFDLVLMDLQMPVLDGHAATRELRARGVELPIVAMTAHDLASDRSASIKAGMNDHLSKPIDPVRLRRLLLQWVDAARVQQRRAVRAPADGDAAHDPAARDFDWRSAFERVNRNPVLFSRLLRNFRQDYAGAVEQLRAALHTQDMAAIRGHAHGLKSSAAYLGAVELSELASRVEKAVRGERDDEALRLVPSMIAGLDAVLAGVAASPASHPHAQHGTDPEHSQVLVQRLTGLLWAADSRAEDALDELEAALGDAHQQAIDAIRESIVEVEYDVALLQLSTLASAMNLTLERAP